MIFTSPIPDIDIAEVTAQQYVFENIPKHASRVAMIEGYSGRSYTFGQLHALVKKCAAGLHQLGFKKGDVLCIYSPNIPEYAIFVHAVGTLGAIVSPANPLYTVEELSYQLKDSGSKFIITIPMFLDKAKEAAARCGIDKIFVFGEAEGAQPFASLLNNDGQVPEVQINPKEDVFMIPYSSGTSGLPKGVLLTHYNLVANVAQVASVEKYSPEEDVLIGILPFYHIYAMTLILNFSIRECIKVIVLPKFELPKFCEVIQEHKVTILHVVPPIMLALAKHPIVDNYNLKSLKLCFSGAAPMGADLEKAVAQRLNVEVKQAYGMTELSPGSHINPPGRIKSGSVGILLANQQAKIVDVETGKLQGINQEGELRIKGPNVMKGYLNNDAANQEAFDEDGFLRTGDIAKVDEDGFYFIMDRLKELIKYKGYQVAPAELEAHLIAHPAIADVCVIGVPDEEAGELPKAYIVLKPGQTLTAEEVNAFIEPRIAPHKKLRGGVQFIDAIPKSSAGKILRRVLRDQGTKGSN